MADCARGLPEVCQKSQSEQVCNEMHVVFDCSLLADMGIKCRRVFKVYIQTMLKSVWQKDIAGVALLFGSFSCFAACCLSE